MPPKRKHPAATMAPAKAPKPEAHMLIWSMAEAHWHSSFLMNELDLLAEHILDEDRLSLQALGFLKDKMQLLLSEDNVHPSEPDRAKKAAARDCMIEVEEELDHVQEAFRALVKKIRALHRIAEMPEVVH